MPHESYGIYIYIYIHNIGRHCQLRTWRTANVVPETVFEDESEKSTAGKANRFQFWRMSDSEILNLRKGFLGVALNDMILGWPPPQKKSGVFFGSSLSWLRRSYPWDSIFVGTDKNPKNATNLHAAKMAGDKLWDQAISSFSCFQDPWLPSNRPKTLHPWVRFKTTALRKTLLQ